MLMRGYAMPTLDEKTKKLIAKLYCQDKQTSTDISKILCRNSIMSISPTQVLSNLHKMGIQVRPHAESRSILYHTKGYNNIKIGDKEKQEIERLYLVEGLSACKIANLLNLNHNQIRNFVRKRGIIRTKRESSKLASIKGVCNPPHVKGKANRRVDNHGYVDILMTDNPSANKSGYIREHRLVWEETHRKKLPSGWHVHHINGNPSDNRPQNLVALPSKKHAHVIPVIQKKVRQLEIENRQLRRALEDSQMIFTISDN